MIKLMAATVCVAFVLCGFFALASDNGSTKDPCSNKDYSNSELRQCYTKAQLRLNAEVDERAEEMAADFRHNAKDEIYGNGVIFRRVAKSSIRGTPIPTLVEGLP
jgi:hypothetical protein